MPRLEAGLKVGRLFRWQLMPITQEYQNEYAREPLSRKSGPLLLPSDEGAGELGHWHRGVDLACPVGTPVRLALSGLIKVPKEDPSGFGLSVQCEGARYRTTYGHLSVVRTSSGAQLIHGDLIGLSGSTGNSTGPHIHWEVWDKVVGAWIDPWSIV